MTRNSDEFVALRALSAALGGNPLRTQAAGGNTSIKSDGVMWIKASGCWLVNAVDQDIMVPVDLAALLASMASADPRAEEAIRFVRHDLNTGGLRPSIETSVHAIIPYPVVAHIHCVETIAMAVRQDAPALVAEKLRDLDDVRWAYIPYIRPGLPLARAIDQTASADVHVLILANHGLVVSGDSVIEVKRRLDRVCSALAAEPRPAPSVDHGALMACVRGSDYRLPQEQRTHALGLDRASLSIVRGGSLYPDHVIFLGPGVAVANDVATGAALRLAGSRDEPRPMLVLPGLGVVLHRSTHASADALALCLADVAARIPSDAAIQRLTPAQEFELTHWEAEKYRQALSAKAVKG
jgi:rhamnose utilization protein RhaD (predicted bifunctional aldolase and dehydrogenase)